VHTPLLTPRRPRTAFVRGLRCLLVVGGVLVAAEAAAVLPVPTDCQNDVLGANDQPGQKDLTKFCVAAGNGSPYDLYTKWNFDEQNISGGNTNDACSLYDTDSDGNANLVVCVTTEDGGGPAHLAATGGIRLFNCGNTRSDRCTSPVQVNVCTINTSQTCLSNAD
jgi:hypothetical protein